MQHFQYTPMQINLMHLRSFQNHVIALYFTAIVCWAMFLLLRKSQKSGIAEGLVTASLFAGLAFSWEMEAICRYMCGLPQ